MQITALVPEDRAGPAVQAIHRAYPALWRRSPPAPNRTSSPQHDRLPRGHELRAADFASRVVTIGEGNALAIALVGERPGVGHQVFSAAPSHRGRSRDRGPRALAHETGGHYIVGRRARSTGVQGCGPTKT